MTQLEMAVEVEQTATPFVKWVGSKRWLAATLVPIIRAHLEKTGGTYREPFLGGGAIALALAWRKAVLGDACKPLIETYKVIQRNAAEVHAALEELVGLAPPSEESYYAVRAAFNAKRDRELRLHDVGQSARFLYLASYGYNGIWRVNSAGEYNVPWCKNAERSRPSLEQLVAVQVALRGAAIPSAQDYAGLLRHAEAGDVIFADSPYHDTFDAYGEDGFGAHEHERLARMLQGAALRGVAVFATNADTPLVRSLYAWADIEDTSEPRKIRPHGSRERARCILIRAGI